MQIAQIGYFALARDVLLSFPLEKLLPTLC